MTSPAHKVLASLTPAQRVTANRYAADLINHATADPVDRQALVLAATQLAVHDGHPTIADAYLRAMSAPLATPNDVRQHLEERKSTACQFCGAAGHHAHPKES